MALPAHGGAAVGKGAVRAEGCAATQRAARCTRDQPPPPGARRGGRAAASPPRPLPSITTRAVQYGGRPGDGCEVIASATPVVHRRRHPGTDRGEHIPASGQQLPAGNPGAHVAQVARPGQCILLGQRRVGQLLCYICGCAVVVVVAVWGGAVAAVLRLVVVVNGAATPIAVVVVVVCIPSPSTRSAERHGSR